MRDFLDIVTLVVQALPSNAWFVYLMGAFLVCACTGLVFRILYWR